MPVKPSPSIPLGICTLRTKAFKDTTGDGRATSSELDTLACSIGFRVSCWRPHPERRPTRARRPVIAGRRDDQVLKRESRSSTCELCSLRGRSRRRRPLPRRLGTSPTILTPGSVRRCAWHREAVGTGVLRTDDPRRFRPRPKPGGLCGNRVPEFSGSMPANRHSRANSRQPVAHTVKRVLRSCRQPSPFRRRVCRRTA